MFLRICVAEENLLDCYFPSLSIYDAYMLRQKFSIRTDYVFMSGNLFRIMIYKQLVLWMTHNAIRTPFFFNLFLVQSLAIFF